MFYLLGKALTFLLQPSTVFMLLVVAGLFLVRREARRVLGFRLAVLGAVGFFIAGLMPLANYMILPLEQRFPASPISRDQDVTGIIMLGGFEESRARRDASESVGLNEAAERLTEATRLALQHPQAKLVFTGAGGTVMSGWEDAAGPVGQLLQDFGVARERIVLEDKGRNTYENAVFTRALVEPKPGERWVLVTSAYHMPRSVGAFRLAGFEVVPHPVDYRVGVTANAMRGFDHVGAGLERTDLAFKEWVGLVVYRLTGRTDALFPGPD